MKKQLIFDAEALSLESWLSKIFVERHKRDYRIEDSHFPREAHRDQFLDSISSRSELEVRNLLRLFLMQSGHLGGDECIRATLRDETPERLLELIDHNEFVRRMLEPPFVPWEGITWVLDLLPRNPAQALAVLDAYFKANAQFFPDGRLNGMSDAEAIIRARYLHWDNPRDVLMNLQPDQFEFLIAALYRALGYEVWVTQASRDGGVDVEASREEPGSREAVLIQCKRYTKTVGVVAVRELRGVVAERQANKGVVIATGGFTKAARTFASRNKMIELLEYQELNVMLNRAFGAKWPNSMSYLIREEQSAAIKHHQATPAITQLPSA
jgi:restriction system protein